MHSDCVWVSSLHIFFISFYIFVFHSFRSLFFSSVYTSEPASQASLSFSPRSVARCRARGNTEKTHFNKNWLKLWKRRMSFRKVDWNSSGCSGTDWNCVLKQRRERWNEKYYKRPSFHFTMMNMAGEQSFEWATKWIFSFIFNFTLHTFYIPLWQLRILQAWGERATYVRRESRTG